MIMSRQGPAEEEITLARAMRIYGCIAEQIIWHEQTCAICVLEGSEDDSIPCPDMINLLNVQADWTWRLFALRQQSVLQQRDLERKLVRIKTGMKALVALLLLCGIVAATVLSPLPRQIVALAIIAWIVSVLMFVMPPRRQRDVLPRYHGKAQTSPTHIGEEIGYDECKYRHV